MPSLISEMCMARPSNVFCVLPEGFESDFLHTRKCTAALFSMCHGCFFIACSSSIINLNFYFSVEVGVRVEAYNCENWIKDQARHINSAFLIFITVNDKGEQLTFPRIKPTTKVSVHSQMWDECIYEIMWSSPAHCVPHSQPQ